MSIISKLKPKFWDYHDVAAGPRVHLFNFRRIWKLAVFLTAGVSLLPLISLAVVDYQVTQKAIVSEILLRTARLASNTRRTISYFLAERKSALDFIDQDNSYIALRNPQRLAAILENLKKGFGGFVDLGVIDASGRQTAYVGPYQLQGKDYSSQEWFKQTITRGLYVSEVFLGYRQIPHLVTAVKHDLPDGSFYVLRATLDTQRLQDILSQLEVSGQGDAFLINRKGLLQTVSRYQGQVFEKMPLPVPPYSERTEVLQGQLQNGAPVIVGYAYISDTPFILMIVKQKTELMKPWHATRLKLIGFLMASISVIVVVILAVATYLVNHIHLADQKRISILHQVEYSNKMASIGRLAAGVAHEINNPLAIINEKAGLIKDLFSLKKEYAGDQKLIGLVDSILSSVERAAVITRRLLNFARRTDVGNQRIKLGEIAREVLGFLHKEAEYRSITVTVNEPENFPQIESNKGSLQEIFLNLFNNAFAAMQDGGHLDITLRREESDLISAAITDDGCGIPESDLNRVFEPFFSTKTESGGTGLGLSITYNLVRELGGEISVTSEVGKGTTFVIRLHVKKEHKPGETNASFTGG
jgi:two-component system NtrC family sensor kinase